AVRDLRRARARCAARLAALRAAAARAPLPDDRPAWITAAVARRSILLRIDAAAVRTARPLCIRTGRRCALGAARAALSERDRRDPRLLRRGPVRTAADHRRALAVPHRQPR